MDYNAFIDCPLKKFLKIISGKWKPLILYHFFKDGDIRFTELWRLMPKISKKVLLEQLKELEEDRIVLRKQLNTFPPEVYYGLSERGKTLMPIIENIEKWSVEDEKKIKYS
jgi:DNA-binding HxlR family transcriptional regulator